MLGLAATASADEGAFETARCPGSPERHLKVQFPDFSYAAWQFAPGIIDRSFDGDGVVTTKQAELHICNNPDTTGVDVHYNLNYGVFTLITRNRTGIGQTLSIDEQTGQVWKQGDRAGETHFRAKKF